LFWCFGKKQAEQRQKQADRDALKGVQDLHSQSRMVAPHDPFHMSRSIEDESIGGSPAGRTGKSN
jgi:hypothetical protein